MTRAISYAAFVTGMVLIVLMTRLVTAGDALTLSVMALIAAAYSVGGMELWQYQQQTRGLRLALEGLTGLESSSDSTPTLETWLSNVPEALRYSVKQRIVGSGHGLPAPVLTPYLVGLLVMLGLMGTFVGMVATLAGAALALEGSSELTAIREGLAAPIEGLGMAFGTSVAGVAASAMLGLIATLSHRERIHAAKAVDYCRDNWFRDDSLNHQRAQAYDAVQRQANALPDAVTALASLSTELEQVGKQISSWTERSSQQLLDQQREFEAAVRADLQSVAATLVSEVKTNLAHAGKETAEMLSPLMQQLFSQTSEGIANDAAERKRIDAQWQEEMRAQLVEDLSERRSAESRWQEALSNYADSLLAQMNHQLSEIQSLEQQRLNSSSAGIAELQTSLGEKLNDMTASVARSVTAIESAAESSTTIGNTFVQTLQDSTEQSRLRDGQLTDERAVLLKQQLELNETISSQVQSQHEALQELGQQVRTQAEQQSITTAESLERLVEQNAEQLAQFAASVDLFRSGSEVVNTSMTAIVEALAASGSRSDEQMGYYVDQAREIIDHNFVTQQTILERLEAITETSRVEAKRA